MSHLLKYNHVSILQEDRIVISDLNFELNKGEFVYLLGKTGSGKSSFLKTIYGDISINVGNAEVCGFNLTNLKRNDIPFLRRKLGIVFQDFQLLNDRSVYENLVFVMKATGWKDESKMRAGIMDVLKKVGLEGKESKKPHELSGGEQQRVSIARALINNPELILADEPTGNLDPETTDEIMQLLWSICSDYNTTIIMATHDYSIIQKFPSKVLKVEQGKVFETNMTAGII